MESTDFRQLKVTVVRKPSHCKISINNQPRTVLELPKLINNLLCLANGTYEDHLEIIEINIEPGPTKQRQE